MSIEKAFVYFKAISSEIAVNFENTAKSIVGLEKNSNVSWSRTITHLTPSLSVLSQLIGEIPGKAQSLALKVQKLDPISKIVSFAKNAGDWSVLAAKSIVKVETWSSARDAVIKTFAPGIELARSKFPLISSAASTLKNSFIHFVLLASGGNSAQDGVSDPISIDHKRGKKIIRHFNIEDKTFATEKVLRLDTVATGIDYHVKQKKYFAENRDRIAQADVLIDYHQTAIENGTKKLESLFDYKNGSWIDSDYFRRLLKSHPGMTFEQIANNFVSAPVNMRYHSVEIEGNERKVGFLRLGIITDPTNGWTNLKELKEMASGSAEGKTKQLERITEITKKGQGSNRKIQESANFAAAQLLDLPAAVERRRQILQDQMLQLVIAQIDKNAESIQKLEASGQFNMVHLSLLNANNKSINSQGWVHREGNQILDMAEIFKEFRGKELIFDGKGPYIDSEGNIHLPQKGPEWPKNIQLNPVFFNTSVQGNTRNDGLQAEINREGISDLFKIIRQGHAVPDIAQQQLKKAIEKLDAGKSNYAIAELLGSAMINANLAFSTGCMSAKDRTGLVAGLIIHNFLSDGVDVHFSEKNQRFRERLKTRFANRMLDQSGPAAKVVMDNTGESILKCSSARFPKISPIKRGRYAFKQLRMTF